MSHSLLGEVEGPVFRVQVADVFIARLHHEQGPLVQPCRQLASDWDRHGNHTSVRSFPRGKHQLEFY